MVVDLNAFAFVSGLFDEGDASQVALGKEQWLLLGSVQAGGVNATGQVSEEHSISFEIERDANPFHQVCDQNLRRGWLGVNGCSVYSVAERRIAAIRPIEDTLFRI